MPDNTVMRRKLASMQQAPRGPRPLGDLPADLTYRVLSTKGGAGQEGGAADGQWGPVTAPVLPGEQPETELSLLREIRDLLLHLPEATLLTMRTQLVLAPREAVSFIALSGTVNIVPGAAAVVVTQAIPPRSAGFLTKVGVNVLGAGNFPDISWQIRQGGTVHNEFSNRIYSAANLNTPDDFILELVQGRTLELIATNAGGVPIDVQGKLVGWMEFLTDNKPYGGASMSGIA
jgi:hypothetical protein